MGHVLGVEVHPVAAVPIPSLWPGYVPGAALSRVPGPTPAPYVSGPGSHTRGGKLRGEGLSFGQRNWFHLSLSKVFSNP